MGCSPVRSARIITAAALFDGHDAAINLVRRLLVAHGAQVVHLGHDRSVAEVVKAAVEEDADGICVSSYQGGHMAYFSYLGERLRAEGATRIKVFGGGGGVILPEEVRRLEASGVEKIYTPDDGMRLGVDGMIQDLLGRLPLDAPADPDPGPIADWRDRLGLSRQLTRVLAAADAAPRPDGAACAGGTPVIGLTGTGGAGKSSLCDELVRRLLLDFPDLRIGVLAIDPARKRSGGALLGDRLRMNSCADPRVFFRSLAAAEGDPGTAAAVRRGAALLGRACGLVLVETSGIGQGDTGILEMADLPVYVMTSEFGAATQLEKINMLDFARMVVVNKFEDKRAEDALAMVRRQLRRNRGLPAEAEAGLPVYGTAASRFNDPGVDRFYLDLLAALAESTGRPWPSALADPGPDAFRSDRAAPAIPAGRQHYLQEIVQAVRGYRRETEELAVRADRAQALDTAWRELEGASAADGPRPGSEALRPGTDALRPGTDALRAGAELLRPLAEAARERLGAKGRELLDGWEDLRRQYAGQHFRYRVREREVTVPQQLRTLSGTRIQRVTLPATDRWGQIIRFLRQEQVPGRFPYTAGVWSFRRTDEDPKRQFAGEGGPERTNRRFHYLCRGEASRRLSVAFDSVTLYGEDPAERPDIHGKIGESGVSIATLDDMKQLFAGFDLCDPATSVSMTINGPAPVILAMFFNTAIDQRVEAARQARGGTPLPPETAARIRAEVLRNLRGTVQADILKEDQAQNTCIFSIEFALRMMGDVQAFLVRNDMRNYYSVSVSGYHIAEAGANPVSQLAFTLANGFTLLEYFLGRGLAVDAVARNLSFFFSAGLDPEYAVLGRVARRIWAIALRDVYGASEASRKLKYHVQTSGRSLHLKEMQFNDIRTTLQALGALTDNCNSLHTNAYDEALTTPTEDSVRLAMAIQLVITREFGLYLSENLLQGSHFLERLSDDLEAAVLDEFLELDARGGVLRAMETQYQRLKIQEQSQRYETLKHSGELPVVGVNTFLRETAPGAALAAPTAAAPVVRASDAEKDERIHSLRAFQERHRDQAGPALARLGEQVRQGGNLFETLMDTVRVASLGQITATLYEWGGKYRRSM
jgi:methylmalonyl-CoA mutase